MDEKIAQQNLLELRDHSVAFGRGEPVVRSVSFDVPRGQIVAIVGESGSGKSVLARSLVALAGENARHTTAEYTFSGRDMLRLSPRQWRAVRGQQIGFILQDALVSLDPLRKLEHELGDGLRIHRGLVRKERLQLITRALTDLQVDNIAGRLQGYSGELSGGQRQRMLIASAMVNRPELLIADEVTSALDTIVQREVIHALQHLRDQGTTIIFISHDLGLVQTIAERVIVMHDGQIVEQGDPQQVLTKPGHEYTKHLIAATALPPRAQKNLAQPSEVKPVLIVEELDFTYGNAETGFKALDGVSLELRSGETLGLVGESGSGKSTLAALALGLLQPTSGTLRRPGQRKPFAWIPQDTLETFDPKHTVGQIMLQALSGGRLTSRWQLRWGRGKQYAEQIRQKLARVGLKDIELARYPRQMSGGQRQRLAIARGLATGAEVLICDEPVSALDAQYRSGILALLGELQGEMGLTLLFISHDLAVVRAISDRVAVLKEGQLVEIDDADKLFTSRGLHPYTQQLLAATF